MSQSQYRYGPWDGGPDPLASPFDVAEAVDEIGDAILAGRTPRDAIEELLRRGMAERAGRQGRRGLDELRRAVDRRRAQVRERGRLDGTLEQVRALLDKAIGQERAELFPDPSDDARMREAELDTLPAETARAVQALSDYEWRSPQARQTFEQIQDLLRREVLDSQFRGMKQALENATPADVGRVKEMLGALNSMLDRAARGEDTDAQFADFMQKFGEFFPGNPQNLDDLVDELARRAAAAQRLMRSLTREQRAELEALSAGILGEAGLAEQMSRLQDALRAARPDLDWGSPGRGRDRMTGGDPLGLGDATTALEELAELDELATTLNQGYAGATLDDIDPEAVARALGREAVDDLRVLQQIERELERQGYVRHVDRRAGHQIIEAQNFPATPQHRIAQMRSQKSRPSRNHHSQSRRSFKSSSHGRQRRPLSPKNRSDRSRAALLRLFGSRRRISRRVVVHHAPAFGKFAHNHGVDAGEPVLLPLELVFARGVGRIGAEDLDFEI